MHMDTDEDHWRNSNGQGTNDKSIDQYDQDTDTYINAASEYANPWSTAMNRVQTHTLGSNVTILEQ